MEDKINQTERKPFSLGFYFSIFLCAIVVDQLVKFFVEDPFRNYYFAFSTPVPQTIMYSVYAVALIVLSLYLYKNFVSMDLKRKLAWTLVFAGAISNVTERVVLGYVRDFIFIFGGILNLADLYILGGVFILLSTELFPSLQERFKK